MQGRNSASSSRGTSVRHCHCGGTPHVTVEPGDVAASMMSSASSISALVSPRACAYSITASRAISDNGREVPITTACVTASAAAWHALPTRIGSDAGIRAFSTCEPTQERGHCSSATSDDTESGGVTSVLRSREPTAAPTPRRP